VAPGTANHLISGSAATTWHMPHGHGGARPRGRPPQKILAVPPADHGGRSSVVVGGARPAPCGVRGAVGQQGGWAVGVGGRGARGQHGVTPVVGLEQGRQHGVTCRGAGRGAGAASRA
jgi:hypothetical protein